MQLLIPFRFDLILSYLEVYNMSEGWVM